MRISVRELLTRHAGALPALASLALLACSAPALAHPGHGADPFHQHGDWLLGLLALLASCGAGGLVWRRRRRHDDDSGPRG